MAQTATPLGAVNVRAHEGDDAPDPMGRVDTTGREFGAEAPTIGASRAFRLAGAVQSMAGPATETATTTMAQEHTGYGRPDPRHADTTLVGSPYGPEDDTLAAQTEITSNTRLPVAFTPQTAPPRPAAGFTGEDPARPAQTPRWLFLRAFDKWAADHGGPVDKVPQPPPHASVPFVYPDDVPGALPSPGGGFHNRREGIGAQPNSFRLLPRPWDELLVNTGAPVAGSVDPAWQAAATQARKGWRA